MKITKKIFKILGITILVIIGLIIIMFGYFNLPVKKTNAEAMLGMTFSSKYASSIGLDWKANYIAMLDDLQIRKIRIPVYWDLVEEKKGEYNFADVDWQLDEARKRNAEIILAVGQKTPRWPECNIPGWAMESDSIRKANLLKLIDVVVRRYKSDSVVKYWQVENEPFLRFGICPAPDGDLLDSEIATAKRADDVREIIVTDSGELSLWIQAAKRADVFGTTMYRTIWKKEVGYFEYPIGPRFFQFKNLLIKLFAHQKNAIVIELQAEPWIGGSTTDGGLVEQFKSMNSVQLRDNVDYAKKVGFPEIYLWGVEWWYWLKVTQDHPELWDTARELFGNNSIVVTDKKEIVTEENIAPKEDVNEIKSDKNIPNKISIKVPFTTQAPFAKWDAYHEEACEEASLIMLKYYVDKKNLTPDIAEKEIQKMIAYQIKNYGDYKDSNAQQIVQLAHDFYGLDNLKLVYDFSKEDLKKYLSLGNPIIVPAAGRLLGNPNFKALGPLYHNLVLIGYDGNKIITNDPGTRKGEGYLYNSDILYNAIHDFSGELNQIERGRKAMIVLE